MGLLFIELAILAIAMFVIAYPLYRDKLADASGATLTESEYSDLLYKKEAAYIALTDLDFDHKTGKINDSDYESVKAQLEADAIILLDQIENFDKGNRSPETTEDASAGNSETKFCHQCGASIKEEHKFCSSCGAKQEADRPSLT